MAAAIGCYACITLAIFHSDTGSLAAILIHIIAWGGILKTSALILFPGAVAAKACMLERAGILNEVLVSCLLVGGYFTWFGYFGAQLRSSPGSGRVREAPGPAPLTLLGRSG